MLNLRPNLLRYGCCLFLYLVFSTNLSAQTTQPSTQTKSKVNTPFTFTIPPVMDSTKDPVIYARNDRERALAKLLPGEDDAFKLKDIDQLIKGWSAQQQVEAALHYVSWDNDDWGFYKHGNNNLLKILARYEARSLPIIEALLGQKELRLRLIGAELAMAISYRSNDGNSDVEAVYAKPLIAICAPLALNPKEDQRIREMAIMTTRIWPEYSLHLAKDFLKIYQQAPIGEMKKSLVHYFGALGVKESYEVYRDVLTWPEEELEYAMFGALRMGVMLHLSHEELEPAYRRIPLVKFKEMVAHMIDGNLSSDQIHESQLELYKKMYPEMSNKPMAALLLKQQVTDPQWYELLTQSIQLRFHSHVHEQALTLIHLSQQDSEAVLSKMNTVIREKPILERVMLTATYAQITKEQRLVTQLIDAIHEGPQDWYSNGRVESVLMLTADGPVPMAGLEAQALQAIKRREGRSIGAGYYLWITFGQIDPLIKALEMDLAELVALIDKGTKLQAFEWHRQRRAFAALGPYGLAMEDELLELVKRHRDYPSFYVTHFLRMLVSMGSTQKTQQAIREIMSDRDLSILNHENLVWIRAEWLMLEDYASAVDRLLPYLDQPRIHEQYEAMLQLSQIAQLPITPELSRRIREAIASQGIWNQAMPWKKQRKLILQRLHEDTYPREVSADHLAKWFKELYHEDEVVVRMATIKLGKYEKWLSQQKVEVREARLLTEKDKNEIRLLVKQLDADDFQEREAAHANLAAYMPRASTVLLELKRNENSLEVKYRLSQLLDSSSTTKWRSIPYRDRLKLWRWMQLIGQPLPDLDSSSTTTQPSSHSSQ